MMGEGEDNVRPTITSSELLTVMLLIQYLSQLARPPHQEAVNINQSLFVLRRVITALSRRDSSHEEDTRPGE